MDKFIKLNCQNLDKNITLIYICCSNYLSSFIFQIYFFENDLFTMIQDTHFEKLFLVITKIYKRRIF